MKSIAGISEDDEDLLEDDDQPAKKSTSPVFSRSAGDEDDDDVHDDDRQLGSPILSRRVQELRAKSTGKKGAASAGGVDSTPVHHTPRAVLRERNTHLLNENRRLALQFDDVAERVKMFEIERKNEEELCDEVRIADYSNLLL
jgi:hypothetical protein